MCWLVRRWIHFLDDHRLVRGWIVPVVFMSVVLFVLFSLNWTPRQAAEMVAVFLAASLLFALSGMALQVGIERYVRRKRRR